MRTVVLGKNIENIYSIDTKLKDIRDSNGSVKSVYTDKPEIVKNTKIVGWSEICRFEGRPEYNSEYVMWYLNYKKINISENEEVLIEKEIFRADINEFHLRTNKVADEVNIYPGDSEEFKSKYESMIKAFNKMMIESNDKLKTYCDVHKLSYKETDCIELFKLVYPNEEYVIEDGVMKVVTWHSAGDIITGTITLAEPIKPISGISSCRTFI